MLIRTLVENTTISQKMKVEHGLSLYIETKNHKLLFDLGASSLFAENAEKMNVDLSEVDTVIISHGHSDHGGGLKAFLEINSKAKIYLNQHAFGKHYANRPNNKKVYIGLDDTLLPNDRFIFVGDELSIDDELELFANVKGRRLYSNGNQELFKKFESEFTLDDFGHEQNLLINEDGKTLLVAGCAHNGIVNIIDHIIENKGIQPNYVIGGFHLYSPSLQKSEEPVLIQGIAEYLNRLESTYYTCHCTGLGPFQSLKEKMGDRIHYLATGSMLTI